MATITICSDFEATHQQKTGLKIYWAWPRPSEQNPDSPTASPSHQQASITLLSLSIRGQIEWKPQLQETNQTDHLSNKWLQPCLTQWNYEASLVGPPKRSGWRVLTKHGPLEKGMANHFNILALRTAWTVWKGKTVTHSKSWYTALVRG